jgi:hypothetical protein
LNVAMTVLFPSIVIVIGLTEPVTAPDQPANVEPAFAVAVSVTTVPASNRVPGGLMLSVPLPLPERLVVNVNFCADTGVFVGVLRGW